MLKSLVDDNLIDSDKIGTSTFYWSFNSKAGLAVILLEKKFNIRIK